MSNRREFLTRLGTAAGAVGVGKLLTIQHAFAKEIGHIPTLSTETFGIERLRERYLLDPDVVYFNHASIGTIPRVVHEAHIGYLKVCETNPWLYMWGGEWDESRERVREKGAGILGCPAGDVAITHNTTEGFSTLANGLPLGSGDEVVFSSLNHDGASVCWFHNAQTKGFRVTRFEFPVQDVPQMTVDDILNVYDRYLSANTRVLVLPHIDNVIGLLHPVKEIAALAKSKGVDVVAVDGAQSVGMIQVDVMDLGVDVYCASPHKWVQAPKGVGLMYLHPEVREVARPMWVTWGQNRWKGTVRIFEDYGTRNLPELLALGDAIDFQTQLGIAAKGFRYRELWQQFKTRTAASDRVIWRSPESWELGSSLYALEVRQQKSQDVFQRMYRNGGFVFRPFGTLGLNTVRISPNIYTTEEEIGKFFDVIEN